MKCRAQDLDRLPIGFGRCLPLPYTTENWATRSAINAVKYDIRR